MREFGFLLLAVGVVWLLIAFNMDTYVFTGYGERVNNIGLIASKQNHLLISSVISICAILMIIFGKS
ncbi:zinc ribbon domain-containing protein, partial [Salmonella enterica subsp. enterica serovar 1,4,[5],12:i:-]|nr:zinc ribbon domain-containing protein [Salmonella enterica subsp. enterica serovar 1,4,[5],12:i:-]